MNAEQRYEAIVIGVSSGGMNALKMFLSSLNKGFDIPIIIVQHTSPHSDSAWITLLNKGNCLKIKEADEKERIEDRTIYIAPPNYHLLVEKDRTFSLSVDERVNYARPSIDVLFETAADAYKDGLIGVILTGSNSDGTNGLKRIKEKGGLTIVQDPITAESRYMPDSAIAAMQVDHILSLENIAGLLSKIHQHTKTNSQ
ncbi:MAG TPA: chemotaxis protein CheB [Chitinophagaceae bacterium]|nr:chemotaxis protein CheB [Chitinophagaceae bacterium]